MSRTRAISHTRSMAIAVALALGATVCAWALDFPALSGRVVDEAGILDQATRTALTDKLAALEAKSSDQLVVVTLKSLQGTSIEDFGVQLGRRWRIGQKDNNNGALLIVAPSERKVRIEVGYGLEGALTDAVSRLIIENAIIPRFRANDFAGGVTRGVDDIIQVLTGDAKEWQRRAATRPDPTSMPNWVVIAVVVLLSFTVGLAILLGASLGGKTRPRRDRFEPSSSSWSFDTGSSSWSSGSSSSSSSSDSGFSGGGGSFGGGGSSGSW